MILSVMQKFYTVGVRIIILFKVHNSHSLFDVLIVSSTRKASNSFQSTVVYFSNGAASQYNNFKKLANLCHHRRDHDLDAEWHFLLLAMENRPVTKTS